MDYLRFWNTQKREYNTFNDSQGPKILVSEIAIWSGAKLTKEIKAFVIRRKNYKILEINENEIKELKCHAMKIPKVPTILTQAVHWNPFQEEQIAIGLADSHVLHWNINIDKCSNYHRASSYEKTKSRTLTCLQWSPSDPHLLIYGTKDPYIIGWDVRTQDPSLKFANNEGVLDIKFDPFDVHQFACANENHYVTFYDIRYPGKKKFKFSAHEHRTVKCEWNPKLRNRLATSGQTNIKIWDLGECNDQLLKQTTLITTRNCAYSIKWSPLHDNLLASHSIFSHFIEIWDINRKFRPYRHFKETPLRDETWSSQTKMVIHWHKDPHMLLTLNTTNTVVSMHACKDAINMDDFAPSGSITCSPSNQIAFVTQRKPSRRHRRAGDSITIHSPHGPAELPDVMKSIADGMTDHTKPRSAIFTYPLATPNNSYSDKFKFLAKHYRCTQDPFEEICQHNAVMAESQGLVHQAATWKLLSVLFAADEVLVPIYEDEINMDMEKRNKRSVTYDRPSMMTSESPDSCEHESDGEPIERYRYVPDHDSDNDVYIQQCEWDMKDENFAAQQPLNTESTECEDMSDRSSAGDSEVYNCRDSHQDNPTSVRQSRAEMKINSFGKLTLEMLEHLINEGDVQTACTMVIVLGTKLERTFDDFNELIEDIIVPWFYAYLDLLSRFKLWDIQAIIISKGPDRVKMLNKVKSLIYTKCAVCETTLVNGICELCGPSAICGVCRTTVKGLYIWCQGCCHGGHLSHIQEWFKSHRACPAACGHECEYS